MSTYTKSYGPISDAEDRKACTDALTYMGSKMYGMFARGFKSSADPTYVKEFENLLLFRVGVQGRPVEAMKRRYCPK